MPAPKITREKNGRIECSVEFPADQVATAQEKAMQVLSREVKIPGFRPGMAPKELLQTKVDQDHLLEHTVRSLLPQTIENLVKEHNIQTITSPKIAVKKRDPLTISIVFVERPKVTMKGVEKIKIEKKEHKVDDEEVERMIGYIMAKHEKSAEVNRPAAAKDRVTLDFWGADAQGKEIAPIRTTNHAVILGSKNLIPGFEDALLGLKKSDQKSFTLTFPEKYHAKELEGKPVTFHATVTKVEEVTLPELTDAFVKENLGAESAADLRKRVRESMITQEERIERQRREQLLMDEIRKATHVDLAPELVQEETESLLEELEEDLRRRNSTIGDWLKSSGKKPEAVQKEFEERASQRLGLRLGIRELVETKDISISDAEMEKTIAELLAPLSEKERKEYEPAYRKGEKAYDQLLWQKKVEKLFDGMLV